VFIYIFRLVNSFNVTKEKYGVMLRYNKSKKETPNIKCVVLDLEIVKEMRLGQ